MRAGVPVGAAAAFLGALLLAPLQTAQSADLDVPALVAGCTDLHGGARLSADGNVLCFDGPIMWDTPLAPFYALNRDGTLVVRSQGGLLFLAQQMADVLLEKNARVVIHDYCLSACAMALFVASHETHVAAGGIVAWHDRPEGMRSSQCLRERKITVTDFYRRRGINGDFAVCPQTAYSRKMFHAMQSMAIDKSRIFWTWHPDNFRGYFKSKIVFLSFPDEQTVVARMRRSRARVIYDPPNLGESR